MTRAAAYRPAIGAVAVVGVAGFLLNASGGGTPVLTELLVALAAFAAYLGCRSAALAAGPEFRAWRLLALAAACRVTGAVAHFVLVAVDSAVALPSAADVGHLVAVPLTAAGLLSFTTAPARISARLRVLLDGFVIAGSLLVVSWALVLRTALGADQRLLARVVGLSYPVGAVVLAAVALTMLARTPKGDRLVMSLLVASTIASGVADSVFALLAVGGSYLPGEPTDVGWIVGSLLLALAAVLPQRARRPVGFTATTGWNTLLPYAPFVVAAVVSLGELTVRGGLDRVEAWTIATVLGLLVLRQFLTSLDNAALANDLAAAMIELSKREEYFRSLVQGSSDVVVICDARGVLRFVSPAMERIFGHPVDDLIHADVETLVHPDDLTRVRSVVVATAATPGETATVTCRIRDAGGDWHDVEAVLTNQLANPAVRGLVFNMRDVTERRELEDRLTHQAFHDPLTGLANRSLFRDRVYHALALRSRTRNPLAVLFLDLDGFKAINDSLGHAAGDRLLGMTAERLKLCVRPGDTVARLGGDEFAVLLEDVTGGGTARQIGHRILEEMRSSFALDGHEVFVGASVGIADASTSDDADELLRNADLAMYRAKALGKGRCEIFEPAMHAAVVHRLEVESELRQALGEGRLSLRYQPIVDLETGEMLAVEALVRWEHPTRGTVPPAEFIGVAEDSGLIVPIGRWVLTEAVRQVRRWHRLTGEWLRLSVNLSARQLQAPRLAESVADVLRSSGMPADHLVLEITESILVDDADRTIAKLHLLRELGVRLAIDDFGTGYSSLNYLRRLPVQVLKIDRSFVSGLGREQDVTALTAAIVRLGTQLGLDVVAEGIEEPAQLDELIAMGARLGQGYLFDVPLTVDELTERLRGRDSAEAARAAG